ncbi:MAG: S-methyl-5-thioribose-1-phosphate isomerase, partial [Clostridiaceae bacterium]|nr:S-methyl-5-thioribose-1-phosphate isomerase [Clostridiaceae bacterium]
MISVKWQDNQVAMIDQTKLPHSYEVIKTRDLNRIAEAIYKLEIRGGPAIGVTVAYGMAIAAQDSKGMNVKEILNNLEEAKKILNVRPTASNLVWGLEHMENYAKKLLKEDPTVELGELMVEEAKRLAANEIETNLKMAEFGMQVIPDNANIITQCNTGALCTVGIGHVMGTVFYAHQQGKKLHVFTDETRPRLQGAKLNVYELDKNNIPYTLVTDNTAAYLMQLGKV